MFNPLSFYIFIETLAMLMVLSIFLSSPAASQLEEFERFGYATATIGMILLIVGYLKKHRVRPGRRVLFAALLYPVLLWCVYEGINNSPKLLPDSLRPVAFHQGLKVLADRRLVDKDITLKVDDVMQRYPLSDEHIRQLHLDALRGLSTLVQSRHTWSEPFDEEKFKPYVWGLYHKNRGYKKFEDLFFSSAMVSMLSGSYHPMGSRVTTHLSLLSSIEKDLTAMVVSDFIGLVMMLTEHADQTNFAKLNINNGIDERRNAISTKNVLERLDAALPELEIMPYERGQTWQDTIRVSLTTHILKKAGLPLRDRKGAFAFPWRLEGESYRADEELTRLIKFTAPFLVTKSGQLHLPLALLDSPEQVSKYESHFKSDLTPGIKRSFLQFYRDEAIVLSKDQHAWDTPLAMPLFGDFMRVGAILPLMLMISLMLLTLNLWKLYKISLGTFIWGGAAVGLAVGLFFTPLLPWLIRPILLISVPTAVVFVN